MSIFYEIRYYCVCVLGGGGGGGGATHLFYRYVCVTDDPKL